MLCAPERVVCVAGMHAGRTGGGSVRGNAGWTARDAHGVKKSKLTRRPRARHLREDRAGAGERRRAGRGHVRPAPVQPGGGLLGFWARV